MEGTGDGEAEEAEEDDEAVDGAKKVPISTALFTRVMNLTPIGLLFD